MHVPTRAAGCLTAARPIWALVPVGAVLVGFVPAAQASADRSGPRGRLAEVQRQAGELEQRAEELESEAAAAEERFVELRTRFDRVAVGLETASDREAAADPLAQDARARADQAATDVAQAELEPDKNEQELAEIARRADVHGRSTVDPLTVAIATTDQDAGQLAQRLHYLERTLRAQAAALESATALTVRLAAFREQAAVMVAATREQEQAARVSLGPSLEALLAAAAADGFVLGGSGNRSPEVTARLRVANGRLDVYDFTWLSRQRSVVRLPQPAVRSLALVPERQMTTTPPTTHNARVVAKLAQIGPGVPS